MRAKFFCTNFLNTARGPGHPGKIPGTSRIPLFETQGRQSFEGGHEVFGHHPFAWKTPTPPGGLRTQKLNLCALFSCLTFSKELFPNEHPHSSSTVLSGTESPILTSSDGHCRGYSRGHSLGHWAQGKTLEKGHFPLFRVGQVACRKGWQNRGSKPTREQLTEVPKGNRSRRKGYQWPGKGNGPPGHRNRGPFRSQKYL